MDGDWAQYRNELYACFTRDFLTDPWAMLLGKRVVPAMYPRLDDFHGCFWHLIQEGSSEETRIPEPGRYECIEWPRAIIECFAGAGSGEVVAWHDQSRGDSRLVLTLSDFSYAVILAAGRAVWPLLAAYPVERDRRRLKLENEYEAAKIAGAALQ